MINLTFVQPKNKLKMLKYNNELITLIVSKIKEIDNYLGLKFDNELLKFVCNCIENGLKDKNEKKNKTDKKQLCIDVYNKCFTLTDAEKEVIASSIQFLHDNNLIVKVHSIKRCSSILANYVLAKL
jgi:hypothetical protein